jgi:hypothetical protein
MAAVDICAYADVIAHEHGLCSQIASQLHATSNTAELQSGTRSSVHVCTYVFTWVSLFLHACRVLGFLAQYRERVALSWHCFPLASLSQWVGHTESFGCVEYLLPAVG